MTPHERRAEITAWTAANLHAIDTYRREQHGIRICRHCKAEVAPFRRCPCRTKQETP